MEVVPIDVPSSIPAGTTFAAEDRWLAAALRSVLTDPGRLEQLARAARARYVSAFTIEAARRGPDGLRHGEGHVNPYLG